MRWQQKINWDPELGDKRILTRFLLFPKAIEGETRWLETVSFEQEYIRDIFWLGNERYMRKCWTDIRWVD